MTKVKDIDIFHINQSGIGSLAGSSGYGGVSLSGNFYFYVCILQNEDTYIGFKSGNITWSGSGLVHGNSWPLYFAGGSHAFSGKTTSIPSAEFVTKIADDVASYSSTYLSYNLPTVSGPSVGSEFSSSGWYKAKSWTTWPPGSGKKRTYNFAFPAHNAAGDVNQVTFNSFEITLESEIFDPFYFPGKVKQSDGNWWSCNRKNSTYSTGFFRHKKGGAWKDRLNKNNSSSESTVFIHNGSGWNTIAPKIGKE